jgi:hypothetical protein
VGQDLAGLPGKGPQGAVGAPGGRGHGRPRWWLGVGGKHVELEGSGLGLAHAGSLVERPFGYGKVYYQDRPLAVQKVVLADRRRRRLA